MLLVLSSNISLSLEDIVCLIVEWRASRQWKGETVPSVHSLLMLVLFVPLIRLMLVCLTLLVSSCLQNALPTLLNRPCTHAFGWSFQHWLNPLPILFSVPVGGKNWYWALCWFIRGFVCFDERNKNPVNGSSFCLLDSVGKLSFCRHYQHWLLHLLTVTCPQTAGSERNGIHIFLFCWCRR